MLDWSPRLFCAAISSPPVSLQAISVPDYFAPKQFQFRRHQIFLIFYIYNIIVLLKKIFYFIFVSMYYILLISFGAADHVFSHKIFLLFYLKNLF